LKFLIRPVEKKLGTFVSLFVPFALLYRSTDFHEIWYIGVFEYDECFGGIYFAIYLSKKAKNGSLFVFGV